MKLTAEEAETLETYNSEALSWDETTVGVWWDPGLEHFVNLAEHGDILEAGCATGRSSQLFLHTAGCASYTGIDLSLPMVRVAQHNYQTDIEKEKARFSVMDVCELGFLSESFSGFLCAASLMHVPRLKTPKALKELRRVLKPGGVGHIATPQGKFEGMYKPSNRPGRTLSVCWEPKELEMELRKAKLKTLISWVQQHMLYMIVQRKD